MILCLFSIALYAPHVYSASSASPLLFVNSINQAAIQYVGNTNPHNGTAQLELLMREGLQPTDYVLEVGCGALVAGIPIMSFLAQGHYVGIEPNRWLIDKSLLIAENKQIVDAQQPRFLYNATFDARNTGITFDYVLAHSIISHAPLWQFRLFLQRCADVLKDGGKVIFSLRLTEPNNFDGLGEKEESTTDEWQYPGNTFFHRETVMREATQWFKHVEQKKLYTELIMATDPSAFHEWFVLTK